MSPNRKNVLVIGVSPAEFGRVLPLLGREAFDVDRFPSAEGALELISKVPFQVLLVRHPLLDMNLEEFLGQVRAEESPCRQAPLLLLATDGADGADEAGEFIGRGANRVLDLESEADSVEQAVSDLLAVAPRKSARFLARLEVKLGDAKDMMLCQTENLSASGMLIKTDSRYETGTRIHFEFSLPEDPRPIVGSAEVVRHTMIGRDRVGGVGVRFLSFSGDSQQRFETFLTRL